MAERFTTPTVINLTLTGAWQTVTIPKGTSLFQFKTRVGANNLLYGFNGHTEYVTLFAGGSKFEDHGFLQQDVVLHVQGTAADVLELEYWS